MEKLIQNLFTARSRTYVAEVAPHVDDKTELSKHPVVAIYSYSLGKGGYFESLTKRNL